MRASLLPALMGLSLLAACRFDPASRVEPVVQRHKLSNSTRTLPAGTYQVEGGVSFNPGDGYGFPVGVRWGASPATEFFATAEALRKDDDVGETGAGDLWAGVRHRLWDETRDLPAVAFEFFGKLPVADADEGLGSGEVDLFLAGSAERHLAGWPVSGYAQLGFLGDPRDNGVDTSLLLAGALQRPVDRNLDAFVELAGLWVDERDVAALFLNGGVLWTLDPYTVLDASMSVGFGDDAESLLLLVGVSRSLGRARRVHARTSDR